MQDNQFVYARQRRNFGRQCLFVERTQQMLNIQPSVRLRLSYILRNPVNTSTQLSHQFALDVMETENVTYGEHGILHFEGGWPKDVNLNDEEATLRYRKKIERDDIWSIQVLNAIARSRVVMDQNNAVNIYLNFFEGLPPELGANLLQSFEAKIEQVFYDYYSPCRQILLIDWLPTEEPEFLGNYFRPPKKERDTKAYHLPPEMGSINAIFTWNLLDTIKPRKVFDSNDVITKAMFCPKDENFVAGGLISGKICTWNGREGGMPLQICPLESAHRERCSAFCWVHSKSNSEFYTGSWDGSVKFWDTRDMEEPFQEVLLDPDVDQLEQDRQRAEGCTVLEFEYTIPVRFIICTDLGRIFVGNRKGSKPDEILVNNYKLFSGPIRTIERNPFFVKNFLVIGDWCAKIWTEETKACPAAFIFKKHNQLSCGSWSPLRSSLFATGDFLGELDFYDLLLDHKAPVFNLKFKYPITHIKFRQDGESLGVCCKNGDVFIVDLDDAMKTGSSKDKALVGAMFERELQRSKLLESRIEEMKLKERTKIETEQRRIEEEARLALEPVLDPKIPEEFLQIIENDTQFAEVLGRFHTVVGEVESTYLSRDYLMERTEFDFYCNEANALE